MLLSLALAVTAAAGRSLNVEKLAFVSGRSAGGANVLQPCVFLQSGMLESMQFSATHN